MKIKINDRSELIGTEWGRLTAGLWLCANDEFQYGFILVCGDNMRIFISNDGLMEVATSDWDGERFAKFDGSITIENN